MNQLDATTFPLSGHKVIEASAGTGKTYTITNLYLRLLLGGSETHQRPLRVNEILVLTFTNAATDELRQRIRQRIISARELFKQPELDSQDPFLSDLRNNSRNLATDAKILTAAIQLMDEAAIYTIHGFCARVLNEQPFETGTLFDQEQDADTNQLLRLASEDFFRSYIQTLNGSAIEVAIDLWPNPEVLSKKIKPLIGRPDITLVPEFSDIERKLSQLEQQIEHIKQTWITEEIALLLENSDINRKRKTHTRINAMTQFCKGQSLVSDLWENFTVAAVTKNLNKAGTYPDHVIFSQITKISESLHLFEQIKTNLWHQAARWIDDRIIHFKEDLGSLTQDDLLAKVDQAISRTGSTVAKDLASDIVIHSNLGQALAKRWPVAMVDEFQDTDGAQYRIFSNIYADQTSSSLFMIGDPKQAIYQFRGADIYTYINAKRQVNPERDLYSLGTNWRSSPRLIKAVNYLFDKPKVFSNDSDIPFIPVESPASKNDDALVISGKTTAPIEIFTITKEHKTINKTEVLRAAMAYTALEVSRLHGSPETQEQLDIAILVRNRIEMRAAKSALDGVGVRSVYVTQDSVLNSSTAEDLSLFLLAVVEPGNVSAIRSALASRLCQSSAFDIESINNNLVIYEHTLSEFQSYHDCWSKMGVATMVGRFIEGRNLAQKWLGQDEGDRELTNLRHLGELLQTQSMTTPGMHSLLQWFDHERQNEGTTQQEDRQLRLDTDSQLVKLVTMHAAKGLEYDVVFIPTATIVARKPDADTPNLFHDESNDGLSFLTKAEVANTQAHTTLSLAESQAENMRLLYVAITRAKKRCYIGIAPISGSSQSPIATLLGLEATFESDNPYSVLSELPNELFSIVNATEMIQTLTLKNHDALKTNHAKVSSTILKAPPTTPTIRDMWRTHSYTGISRVLSARETPVSVSIQEVMPGYQDDDQTGNVAPSNSLITLPKRTKFDQYHFPKGPKVGVALHDLLENLDFTSAPETWLPRISKVVQRVGITESQEAWTSVLHEWIQNVLSTHITPSQEGTPSLEGALSPAAKGSFALSEINATDRLNELEFFFPLDSKEEPIRLLVQNGYLEQNNTNVRLQLQGVMTGFVDLIVAHEGKFYIIDYKSNFLGFNQASYNIKDISVHMTSHRYHLQYLIYCVAVNRYLATRVPDYDYDQHFGGVHYLFLRGMQREIPDSGVFTHRPAKELIAALDSSLMNRHLQKNNLNDGGTKSV